MRAERVTAGPLRSLRRYPPTFVALSAGAAVLITRTTEPGAADGAPLDAFAGYRAPDGSLPPLLLEIVVTFGSALLRLAALSTPAGRAWNEQILLRCGSPLRFRVLQLRQEAAAAGTLLGVVALVVLGSRAGALAAAPDDAPREVAAAAVLVVLGTLQICIHILVGLTTAAVCASAFAAIPAVMVLVALPPPRTSVVGVPLHQANLLASDTPSDLIGRLASGMLTVAVMIAILLVADERTARGTPRHDGRTGSD